MGRLQDSDGGGEEGKLRGRGSHGEGERRMDVHRREQEGHWIECDIMRDGHGTVQEVVYYRMLPPTVGQGGDHALDGD